MPARKLAAFAAALVLTAPAGGPALADTGAKADAFEANFVHLPANSIAIAPAAGAVDVTAIEPAVEEAGEVLGSGVASYYGRRFAGRPTASGERFDPGQLTAAHRTLPFGSKVRVTNPRNGKSVVVRINDRGPFHKGRMIDVSRAAADELGLVQRGHGTVDLVLLD
ncbi:septal ring lytic transglycosylase RlpA family protein [Pelagerythrobacter sp.]|uniref:septal ring lytic transglycosylase RlpA family protein n=1 Tax=Pelagerythrobacter sp. TaxID=2800702 RepID=UPI0035B26505